MCCLVTRILKNLAWLPVQDMHIIQDTPFCLQTSEQCRPGLPFRLFRPFTPSSAGLRSLSDTLYVRVPFTRKKCRVEPVSVVGPQLSNTCRLPCVFSEGKLSPHSNFSEHSFFQTVLFFEFRTVLFPILKSRGTLSY